MKLHLCVSHRPTDRQFNFLLLVSGRERESSASILFRFPSLLFLLFYSLFSSSLLYSFSSRPSPLLFYLCVCFCLLFPLFSLLLLISLLFVSLLFFLLFCFSIVSNIQNVFSSDFPKCEWNFFSEFRNGIHRR